MPSHQVLFRRNDGELLLPAVNPYQAASEESRRPSFESPLLQTASERQSENSYGYKRPEPTCLLRTCDQYITGRDLTYERALEIVQNEEYLVAVDADLIHRRSDYGSTEDFGTTWNNLPVDDHLKLTQYLATVGKRKKREAEAEAETMPDEFAYLKSDEYGGRFFNTTGLGTVTYDWTSVADQYLKLGAAGVLLAGLAAMIPSPDEPVIPITLQSASSSKVSKSEKDEQIARQGDFLGNYDIGAEPSPVHQVYQEDAPARVDRIDRIDRIDLPSLDKIADNKFFKRFDLLAPFRRNKKPKRRPSRPERPAKRPNPAILKPVQNTKKRQIKPKPVQKAPEPVAKTPALTSVQEAAQVCPQLQRLSARVNDETIHQLFIFLIYLERSDCSVPCTSNINIDALDIQSCDNESSIQTER